jgi:hypothetical protein
MSTIQTHILKYLEGVWHERRIGNKGSRSQDLRVKRQNNIFRIPHWHGKDLGYNNHNYDPANKSSTRAWLQSLVVAKSNLQDITTASFEESRPSNASLRSNAAVSFRELISKGVYKTALGLKAPSSQKLEGAQFQGSLGDLRS